ncbi:MAG: thiazole tautomerase TenI [Bacteroidia bacterium]
MMILFTPDNPDTTIYNYINKWSNDYDQCHLKISLSTHHPKDELYTHINQLVSFKNPVLQNKLVIHINEQITDNNIAKLQHLLKDISDTFKILRFHFSENLLNILLENEQTSIFHQYNISASLHHLNIKDHHNHLHYIIYGPVFQSISKKNYSPKMKFSEMQSQLNYVSENTEIPIIAIGGITPDNFQDALKAGFSGLAIRGYVWNSHHPEKKFQTLIDKWKTHQNLS